MGKLTKIVFKLLGEVLDYCNYTNEFIKSCSRYVNDSRKISILAQYIRDLYNNKLDPNKSNKRYHNHSKYGNAYHLHMQEDFILVYDYDEKSIPVLLDITNHNDQ